MIRQNIFKVNFIFKEQSGNLVKIEKFKIDWLVIGSITKDKVFSWVSP